MASYRFRGLRHWFSVIGILELIPRRFDRAS